MRRLYVASVLGIAGYCTFVGSTSGAAPPPEATDPDVARCVQVAAVRLARDGFDRAKVASSDARRADACILRWEAPFSRNNPQRVATLIVVPVDITIGSTPASRTATVSARCGLTDGRIRAFEIVSRDPDC